MKIFAFLIIAAAGLLSSCAATKGEPIDAAKLCDVANDGKYVEAKGVIAAPRSVLCSNIGGGPVKCPFDILESPGGANRFRVDIEQGSGANTVDKLGSGYKKEDIKIRDNDGNPIGLENDVMRFTGKLMVSPDAKVCLINVDKIER